ncbi:hypothetical protein, conserved [Eimeria necatrix]|uniref:RAP domain-containing protein n=1 Tax=Eimeria necatrix TaxID=51315 RepID=U6MJD4_9EIME|nr:hypothetical protein, conserved [Eimeria necatrix]CDJ64126.1 hypothetical protein, conserved [Eimeria necatrix]
MDRKSRAAAAAVAAEGLQQQQQQQQQQRELRRGLGGPLSRPIMNWFSGILGALSRLDCAAQCTTSAAAAAATPAAAAAARTGSAPPPSRPRCTCRSSSASLPQQQKQQQRRDRRNSSEDAGIGSPRRRYLREEGDAAGPKNPRLRPGGPPGDWGPPAAAGGPHKLLDLEGPGGPPEASVSEMRFLERHKKPHEYALERKHAQHSEESEEGSPHQWREAPLLPLAEAVPSLKREDLEQMSPATAAAPKSFGVLGVYKATERDYYRRFFRDRDRALDGQQQPAAAAAAAAAGAADGVAVAGAAAAAAVGAAVAAAVAAAGAAAAAATGAAAATAASGARKLHELQQLQQQQQKQQLLQQATARRKRYIPPKEYWYSGRHEPPTALTAAALGARDLKFVLMREARRIRMGALIAPAALAAAAGGLAAPAALAAAAKAAIAAAAAAAGGAFDLDVWEALEGRAAAICRESRNASARSLLRMLQAFAAVQLPLKQTHMEDFMRAITKRQAEMRPENYVHLFQASTAGAATAAAAVLRFGVLGYLQALARLRLRHRICLLGLQEMLLSWAVLRNNFLIKAANSLSKLDLATHVLVTPLRLTLASRIPAFTGSSFAAATAAAAATCVTLTAVTAAAAAAAACVSGCGACAATNCRSVKWVTGVSLFSSAMLVDFLNCAAKQEKKHLLQRHSRDLQLMELYLRIQKPEVYEQLDIETQYFLEVIRNASTATFSDCSDTEEEAEGVDDFAAAEVPSWGVCTPRDAPDEGPGSGPTPHKAAFRSKIEADAFFTPGERGPPSGSGAPAGAPGPSSSGGEAELGCSKVEVAAATAGAAAGPHEGPPAAFSSALHADISRVLNLMEVSHFNSAVAGPFKTDCYLPSKRLVIEGVPSYQLYANTHTPTATSKL